MQTRLYHRVRDIIDSARVGAARSVNTAQVVANWLIGREIVEEEQRGQARADYGERLLRKLAGKLRSDYGPGYGETNLKVFKKFYLVFPGFLDEKKSHALRDLSGNLANSIGSDVKGHTVSGLSIPNSPGKKKGYAVRSFSSAEAIPSISHTVCAKSWKPGGLHPNLSWTHYRTLLKADEPAKRAFYEIEAIKNGWSARELERQMASLLFERLAKSRDKAGLMELAAKGQEVQAPADVFKDPVVIEFLGLPESPRLAESDLEAALIGNLREFLLEMGKGFAFVARQERLSLDGDHFYVDLVFYHAVLKCYALVDLKVGKLTHQDLGQMQLYVNYFDRERRTEGDGPTIGLILCTDKNDAVVRYTLGEGAGNIFASRYKLHLPSEAELRAEVRREVHSLRAGG
jgi:predicted nuclease of restriction endonuclease-like (RecB) superfamily